MSKIIQDRWTERIEEYVLIFDVGRAGISYSFPCDANGVVYINELSAAAIENYYLCSTSRQGTVEDRSYSYVHPAILLCECGLEVPLMGFTNTCDCGRDYSMSGQLLAPRSQWGEETGESAAEILMGGHGAQE